MIYVYMHLERHSTTGPFEVSSLMHDVCNAISVFELTMTPRSTSLSPCLKNGTDALKIINLRVRYLPSSAHFLLFFWPFSISSHPTLISNFSFIFRNCPRKADILYKNQERSHTWSIFDSTAFVCEVCFYVSTCCFSIPPLCLPVCSHVPSEDVMTRNSAAGGGITDDGLQKTLLFNCLTEMGGEGKKRQERLLYQFVSHLTL